VIFITEVLMLPQMISCNIGD